MRMQCHYGVSNKNKAVKNDGDQAKHYIQSPQRPFQHKMATTRHARQRLKVKVAMQCH